MTLPLWRLFSQNCAIFSYLLWALTAVIGKFINNHSKSGIYYQPSIVQQKTLCGMHSFLVGIEVYLVGKLVLTEVARILSICMSRLLVNIQAAVVCKLFSTFLAKKTLPWVHLLSVLHESFSRFAFKITSIARVAFDSIRR